MLNFLLTFPCTQSYCPEARFDVNTTLQVAKTIIGASSGFAPNISQCANFCTNRTTCESFSYATNQLDRPCYIIDNTNYTHPLFGTKNNDQATKRYALISPVLFAGAIVLTTVFFNSDLTHLFHLEEDTHLSVS